MEAFSPEDLYPGPEQWREDWARVLWPELFEEKEEKEQCPDS